MVEQASLDKDKAQPERIYYYANDPNGCPTRLLDETGKVVWAALYDAWGKVKKLPANEVDQPLRLQGQYFDAETGLHYNRFRYYEPRIGSFISQDPLGLIPGENVYAFGPNVQNWFDPLGLCTKPSKSLPGPKLPDKIAETFTDSKYVNRKLDSDTTFYKYHGVNNRTGRKYTWFVDKKYASEDDLRSALAIRHDWGVKITSVSKFNVPKGTWVSEGTAAPQGVGYPGGGYQGVVSNVPKAWITNTSKAF